MQMMNAHDRETCGTFSNSSFSEGVSAMITTINLPWLTALSGMLAWLHIAYRGKQTTAVALATVPMSQTFMKETR